MITEIDSKLFQKMLTEARLSPRKRSHHNIHKTLEDPVQKLCIALLKGTYIRPHLHKKSELVIPLKGNLELVIFDNSGRIIDKKIISPESNLFGVEVESETWHTFYPLDEEAFAIEIKKGPFEPIKPEEFAVWAPAENEISVNLFYSWMYKAKIKEIYNYIGVSNE